MSIVRKVAVYILLTSTYGITYLIALLGSIIPRRSWNPTGRVLVTGTFYNDGWYLSHVTPLSRCGMKEVIMVTDEPQLPLERVKVVCPPSWALRLFGRIGARTIWVFIAGFRYRPDLYMGYYLAPGACTALVVGKLLGRPSCYQMTSGPVTIVGGGFAVIDSIEGTLGRPSKLIETLALRVIRKFELVIVRGNRAKEFLATRGIKDSVTVITGSVNSCRQQLQNDRDIHLIFIGRLSPVKQVDQFINIVREVAQAIPSIRAVIIGDGPLADDLKTQVTQLGLKHNIQFLGRRKDVSELLAHSKIFILPSKTEGLSIALAEAMTSGVVPVVADVGELGDLVEDGVNGYLIQPNSIEDYVDRVMSILGNFEHWQELSGKACNAAMQLCDVSVVSKRWHDHLQATIARAPGFVFNENNRDFKSVDSTIEKPYIGNAKENNA